MDAPHGQDPGPEWWERLAARWAGWRRRHQRVFDRLARVRLAASWVILLALLVSWVVFPEFRSGLRIWLWLYLLLGACGTRQHPSSASLLSPVPFNTAPILLKRNR